MSTPSPEKEIVELEERLHAVVGTTFSAAAPILADRSLRVELEPIHRHGEGSGYRSHIEAVVRYPDGDVHDILYLPIAEHGRVVIVDELAEAWVKETVAEILEA